MRSCVQANTRSAIESCLCGFVVVVVAIDRVIAVAVVLAVGGGLGAVRCGCISGFRGDGCSRGLAAL